MAERHGQTPRVPLPPPPTGRGFLLGAGRRSRRMGGVKLVMTYLETQIAELEEKAAQFVELAGRALRPDEQEQHTLLAQELYKTIDVLKRSYS